MSADAALPFRVPSSHDPAALTGRIFAVGAVARSVHVSKANVANMMISAESDSDEGGPGVRAEGVQSGDSTAEGLQRPVKRRIVTMNSPERGWFVYCTWEDASDEGNRERMELSYRLPELICLLGFL